MLTGLSLIIAIAGVAVGVFSFISLNNYINDMNTYINEKNSYVPPMARVYYDGLIYSIPSGSFVTFNYTQKSYDNRDAFNLTSDSYKVPGSGFYQVIAQCSIDANDGDFFIIQLHRNGVLFCSRSCTSSVNTNTFGVALTDIINFEEGDSLTIKLYQYNPGNNPKNIFDGEAHTFFAIAKIT